MAALGQSEEPLTSVGLRLRDLWISDRGSGLPRK
jgi:hypothetical protein